MELTITQRSTLQSLLENAYNNTSSAMRHEDSMRDFLKATPFMKTLNLRVSDGASKIAIVVAKWRIVLKWSYDYRRDEARKEVEIYNKAIDKGLAMFFPQTEFFCQIGPYNVILQEMIDFSCSDTPYDTFSKLQKSCQAINPKVIEKARCEIKYACSCYRRALDGVWISRAFVLYGKRKIKALCEFIKEQQINDLHGNNIGYLHKRPVILDFCGYYD